MKELDDTMIGAKQDAAYLGKDRNAESNDPSRGVGASTRLTTSASKSALQDTGILPPARSAHAQAWDQICSDRCWPSRIMPSCCKTDLHDIMICILSTAAVNDAQNGHLLRLSVYNGY